jgi:hypothetical protein
MKYLPKQAIGILAALALLAPTGVRSDEPIVTPLPPDAKPFDMTMSEWAGAWGQRIFSLPKASHPLIDTTGQFAAVGQSAPVWFLGGPPAEPLPGSTVTRKCTIPAGVATFFPIYTGLEFDYPVSQKSEEELRAAIKAAMDQVKSLEASVDGVPLTDLTNYRVRSPIFALTIAPGNLFDIPVEAGTALPVRGVTDGYYLFLPPLPEGQHVIRFRGTHSEPDGTVYGAEAIYNVTVPKP